MEVRLGNIFGFSGGNYAGNVYDKDFLAPTLNTMQGGCKQPMIIDDTYANREPRVYDDFSPALRSEREGFKTLEMKRLGNVYNEKFNGCDFGGNVWDKEGIAPTMKTTAAASQQCVIVAMRGRNPENPSDRTVGSPTEQRLEPNSQGLCNTLTSVQKDNLVMEKVRIKQATSQGYIECEVGGVADLSFPESKTRRGRVQENGQVSPTLMAGEQDICRIEPQLVGGIGEKWGDKQYRQGNRVYDSESVAMAVTSQPLGNMGGNSYMYLTREPQYRIRKLTPRECWSLMNFSEDDFNKAAEVNSNTQLYKQAGNSIVKNVLVAIIGQMIPGKEEVYKNI